MPKSKQRQKKRPSSNKRFEKKMEAVQRLNPFVSNYIKKIEAENEQMKTDPNTTIGQIIPQLRQAITQNKRLSVLAAAFIESQGGSLKITKEVLESFESKVLSIKWTLPEGEDKVDEASEFVFTYEALTQEEADARAAQITVTSNDAGEATSVEIVAAEATDVPPEGFEPVAVDAFGNPVNDLGNTVAAQEDMDAVCEAHDAQVELEDPTA